MSRQRGETVNNSRREAIERQRRNWRVALITIIIVTLPLYCAGIFLWGTAPQRTTPTPAPLPTDVLATQPPVVSPSPTSSFGNGFATITSLPITIGVPTQVIPTQVIPTVALPTLFIPTLTPLPSPTSFVPTNPPPPTAAPLPTNPPPPTQPAITNTPLPFDN